MSNDGGLEEFVVAGPWSSAYDEGENGEPLWKAEVQDIGGWSVIATVVGDSERQAANRAAAIVKALSQPAVRLEAEAAPGISCPSCDGEGSCTICGGVGRIMSLDLATQPAENAKGGEEVAVSPIIEWVVELARRDIMREQTDFIGRMHQAMGEFESICYDHPDGDFDEAVSDDAGEALAGLAGLALAQLAMVNCPADPLSQLAPPTTQPTGDEPVGLDVDAIVRKWLPDMETPSLSARSVSLKAAIEEALHCLATPARPDTVSFVQEWMMSGDHEADQWHKDFAAAIDARKAITTPARTDDAGTGSDPAPVDPVAGGEALREAVARFLADWDDGDRADAGLNPLMAGHISDFRAALKGPAA